MFMTRTPADLRDKWRAMEKERVWVNLDSSVDELEEGTEGD